MIFIPHFIDSVVEPTLKELGMYSKSASNLMVGTALVESDLKFLRQKFDGPALGLYQMEPATHSDIWKTYLSRYPEIALIVRGIAGYRYHAESIPATELITNLAYATAMTRIHYWRVPSRLPEPGDTQGLGNYWKTHYNTHKGAGHVFDYVDKYRRKA